jgi:hypothetical protein
MNYQQIADSLNSGDLMLFAANFDESRLIELVTGFPFSHCGMVVRIPGDNNVYFLESVGDSKAFRDPIDHKMEAVGVRVVNLQRMLAYYMPFTNNLLTYRKMAIDRTPAWEATLMDFIKSVDGTPFPNDESMLVNYVLGHYRNIKASTNVGTQVNVMFCAQLVAATYQALGILPPEIPNNYFAPADFSSLGEAIPLLQGKLGPDLLIHWDGAVMPAQSIAATAAAGKR